MPYREPDPEDPMQRVGVTIPVEDDSSCREMAACFAEEYARQGWNRRRLLEMFSSAFYSGPHLAWLQLGEEAVTEIIDQAVQMWKPMIDRQSENEKRTDNTIIDLPVIQT